MARHRAVGKHWRFAEWPARTRGLVNGIDSTNSCASRYFPCESQSWTRSETRVVSGERVFKRAELIYHAAKVSGSKLQVHSRRKQLCGIVSAKLFLFGDQLAGFWQQLHQSNSVLLDTAAALNSDS